MFLSKSQENFINTSLKKKKTLGKIGIRHHPPTVFPVSDLVSVYMYASVPEIE